MIKSALQIINIPSISFILNIKNLFSGAHIHKEGNNTYHTVNVRSILQ
jgi:hypothetical protein